MPRQPLRSSGVLTTLVGVIGAVTRDTPFDHFLAGEDALSARQERGAKLFFTRAENGGAGCFTCHSGPMLNKQFDDPDVAGVGEFVDGVPQDREYAGRARTLERRFTHPRERRVVRAGTRTSEGARTRGSRERHLPAFSRPVT